MPDHTDSSCTMNMKRSLIAIAVFVFLFSAGVLHREAGGAGNDDTSAGSGGASAGNGGASAGNGDANGRSGQSGSELITPLRLMKARSAMETLEIQRIFVFAKRLYPGKHGV